MRYGRQLAADVGSQVISQAFAVGAVVLGAGVWGLAGGAVVQAVIATVLFNLLSTGFHRPVAARLARVRRPDPLWHQVPSVLVRLPRSRAGNEHPHRSRRVAWSRSASGRSRTGSSSFLRSPSARSTSWASPRWPTCSHAARRSARSSCAPSAAPRLPGPSIFATFAAVSPKLIPAVFGARWEDAALIIPLICLSTLLHGSISVAATSYLTAAGRPGIVVIASVCLGVIWLASHRRAPAQHRRRCHRHWKSCRRFGRRGGAQRGDEANVGRSTVPTSHPTARSRAVGRRPRLAALRRGSRWLLDRRRGRALHVRRLRAWPLGRVPQRRRRHRPTHLGIGAKRIATPSQAVRDNRVGVMKLTVGIPTFNRAEWLRRSIESVLAQSFTDFQLIVSDNASDDDTPEVVRSLRRRPDSLHALQAQCRVDRESQSPDRTRRNGISSASAG